MKFNFKIQQYQTDAVDAVVRVFQGQGFHDKISYIRDRGKVKAEPYQLTLGMSDEELEVIDPLNDTGTKHNLNVMIKRLKTAFISRLCLLFMLLLRTDSGRGFSISDVLIPDSQQDLTIKEAKTN